MEEEQQIVHQLDLKEKKSLWREVVVPVVVVLAIVLSGAVTGYFLSRQPGGTSIKEKVFEGDHRLVSGAKEMGVKDETAFPDKAQGKLQKKEDGVVVEGSHQLLRPGGAGQTAYLTSSVVNLEQFIGKCVEVWGETFAAQKAGWLMDVGYVRELDQCPEGL
jgi:hypothetical protein